MAYLAVVIYDGTSELVCLCHLELYAARSTAARGVNAQSYK